MPQPSYAYAVARVRVLEGRLLSRERLERMLQAGSAEGALKVLAETDYAQGVAELKDPLQFEQLLRQEQAQVVQLIDTITPNKRLTDLFRYKYDLHNLKVLLKGGPATLLLPLGTLPLERLTVAVEQRDYRDLPAPLAAAIRQAAGRPSDQALDSALYEWLFATLQQEHNPFLQGYFERQVDLINLRTLLRAKALGLKEVTFLPHGSLLPAELSSYLELPNESLASGLSHTAYGPVLAESRGNLTSFERLADNLLLGYVKAEKHDAFGLAPLIGYLLAKETELQAIRLVLVGLSNNLEPSAMRERLRELYA